MKTTSLLPVVLILAIPAAALGQEYEVQGLSGGYAGPGSAQTTTVIASGQDDRTVEVQLPFEFPYFGRLQDRVSVCSNGWLAFGSTTSTLNANPALPSTASPDAVIAPLWDDLTTGSGAVLTFVEGTAPSRVLVIDWSGVDTFSAANANNMTFQVRLHEGSGAIVVAYASGGTWNGLSFTAGIEDPTGTIAFGTPNTDADNAGQPAEDYRLTPRTATFTGTVLRDRPVADATGLGNSTETGLVVADAEVVLLRADTGETAARMQTDSLGEVSISAIGVDAADELHVDLRTTGDSAIVTDTRDDPYTHRLAADQSAAALTSLGSITLDAAVDTSSPHFRRALNVQQAAVRGHAYAQKVADTAATPVTILPLEFRWVAGVAPNTGTAYIPATETAPALGVITDAAQNPDPWDDDLILREYGHHVLAALAEHPGQIAPPRTFDTATTAQIAWADGFAYWFAATVQDRAVLVDTTGPSSAVTFDLEAPPAAARGDNVVGAVAASLWELVDPANESEDEFAGTTGAPPSTAADVLLTVDGLAAATGGLGGNLFGEFVDAWLAGGTDSKREQSVRAFIHHGTVADDGREPDDRISEASASGGGGTTINGLTVSPYNPDVFQVDVAGPGPEALIFSVDPVSDVALELALLDSGGAEIASVSRVSGATPQSLELDIALPLPPGTYYVRVATTDGGRSDYALSVFAPLQLTLTGLPPWTAGIPYKQDLVVVGGVPPYTLSLTESVPGLSSAENDTRLVGTPTTPGSYDVDVSATDSAAPAKTSARTYELVINPPPSVAPLVGVPAGRAVMLDLGTGGTDTVWTPLASPPGGLSLLGGAVLRLEGTAGGPDYFVVMGSAVDAVGATLQPEQSEVVVTAKFEGVRDAPVPSRPRFGYYFDGLAGSDVELKFMFSGRGETPRISDIANSVGGILARDDFVFGGFGRKASLRFTLPSTDRFHVILEQLDFAGTVRGDVSVKAPRRVKGQAAIVGETTIVDVPFHALAGTKLVARLERSPSPTRLRPIVVALEAPNGALLPLPTQRPRNRGRRRTLRMTLPQDGRYVLRVGGVDGSTGPMFYRLRLRTPRGAGLELE